MKKTKFNLGILAVLLGVSTAFAFKSPAAAKTKTADVWYQYNGNGQSNPNNYTKLAGDPACSGTSTLCAIQGPDNGLHPSQATVNNPDATENKN